MHMKYHTGILKYANNLKTFVHNWRPHASVYETSEYVRSMIRY